MTTGIPAGIPAGTPAGIPLARQAMAPVTASVSTPGSRPADRDPAPLLSFDTLFDTVNPLQHLPVVSTAYRAASGDVIGAPARLAGGFLFGGPMGLLASAATVAFEAVTGGSVADHALAAADALSAKEKTAPPTAALPTAALPWLKPETAEGTRRPDLPSAEVVARALDRLGGRKPAENGTEPAPATPSPAPETVARLYALEATRPEGGGKAGREKI
ncbi:MAG TPA: hypothetical protein VK943_18120 [Arenibaculum sp.]|nr:hypothetical protein [Arenibaculum sp.]